MTDVVDMPETASPAPGRRGAKSASAFRTISEVASDLDIPQHVLRFWETRFSQIRPLKRAGGRRYYRPEDVELLRRIRGLLYQHGYTIKGVQKLLRDGARAEAQPTDETAPMIHENGASTAPTPSVPSGSAVRSAHSRGELQAILDELVALRELLRARKRPRG